MAVEPEGPSEKKGESIVRAYSDDTATTQRAAGEGSTPMAQSWSSKIISMIEWIQTSRLSMKNSLFSDLGADGVDIGELERRARGEPQVRAHCERVLY